MPEQPPVSDEVLLLREMLRSLTDSERALFLALSVEMLERSRKAMARSADGKTA